MFNLRFKVREANGRSVGGDIDMDVTAEGNIVGLWLDGEDYSENGEVLEAITQLIGPELIARRCSDIALARSVKEIE